MSEITNSPRTRTQELYERGRELIPGGTQLLSKRPELYAPGLWPAYFKSAKGIEVTDLDGRVFSDFATMGIGACVLGYGCEAVDEAVIARIRGGSTCTLNAPEEVALAEKLVALHTWADQVRFTRSGGEAMAVAVRIARAITGRSVVAVCGYHGWSDWYLAANLTGGDALGGHLLPGLEPAGVPVELTGTTFTFRYNQLEELQAIVAQHGARLAAIVMEPMRYVQPSDAFLEKVRATADRLGAVLIFDEITNGFRANLGGSHLRLGVNPDIAVYAKALGNGYPIGAVVGHGAVMDGAQRAFISSTSWTEGIGSTAALATLAEMERTWTWTLTWSRSQSRRRRPLLTPTRRRPLLTPTRRRLPPTTPPPPEKHQSEGPAGDADGCRTDPPRASVDGERVTHDDEHRQDDDPQHCPDGDGNDPVGICPLCPTHGPTISCSTRIGAPVL